MKVPRPKPHNPMPPPAEVHRDQRKEAEKRACRKREVQKRLDEDSATIEDGGKR